MGAHLNVGAEEEMLPRWRNNDRSDMVLLHGLFESQKLLHHGDQK